MLKFRLQRSSLGFYMSFKSAELTGLSGQYSQLKQIADAIYEALPQTLLLFLSKKEAKKLLKHKDFAFCGKRPRARPLETYDFLKKID